MESSNRQPEMQITTLLVNMFMLTFVVQEVITGSFGSILTGYWLRAQIMD